MIFRKTTLFSAIFDTLAFLHLLIAVVIVLLGEFTKIFTFISPVHGGIGFIFKYLDYPVYYLVQQILSMSNDVSFLYLKCLFIICLSSVVYGLVCYFVVCFIKSLFESD